MNVKSVIFIIFLFILVRGILYTCNVSQVEEIYLKAPNWSSGDSMISTTTWGLVFDIYRKVGWRIALIIFLVDVRVEIFDWGKIDNVPIFDDVFINSHDSREFTPHDSNWLYTAKGTDFENLVHEPSNLFIWNDSLVHQFRQGTFSKNDYLLSYNLYTEQ